MQFTFEELINRARVYLDDDHDDTGGWMAPETWLNLANVEYTQLYRRWVRIGLVSPAPTDTTFSGTHTVNLTGVLAIVGVAEDLGDGNYRVLTPAQSIGGANPFWSTVSGSPGVAWKAHGVADSLVVTLEPRPTSGNYFVRFIPTVAYADSLADTLDLPFGCDERLVLGMAKRANVKGAVAQRAIDELIYQADGELNFAAFSKLQDSPRVRKVRRPPYTRTDFPVDPALYRYL